MASGQAIAISLSCFASPNQWILLSYMTRYEMKNIIEVHEVCMLTHEQISTPVHSQSSTLSFILKGRTAPKVSWLVPSWMTEWLYKGHLLLFSNSKKIIFWCNGCILQYTAQQQRDTHYFPIIYVNCVFPIFQLVMLFKYWQLKKVCTAHNTLRFLCIVSCLLPKFLQYFILYFVI